MEEPEEILRKIMEFEEQYRPQFTNLIKQSIVDNVSLEDGDLNIEDDDTYPQLPEYRPITKTSVSDTNILSMNNNNNNKDRHHSQSPLNTFVNPLENTLENNDDNDTPSLQQQFLSFSQPAPNTMPSYNLKKKPNHRHKQTPIMARAGSSQNSIKLIDQDSFLIIDDLQYNSDEDRSDSNDNDEDRDRFIVRPKIQDDNDNEDGDDQDGSGGGGGSVKRYSSEEDEFEESQPKDPLIEEYDMISHEIHKSKLKLRKLDRQMTVAQRNGTSASDLVKQHADIKVKISQLISKRRALESHDIVRDYIKEDDTPTVEIGVF